MKADRRFRSEGDGGGGSEDLRSLLRHWSVPPPSQEIEDQLRRTFRRGRAKKRLAWLAVAATLAVGAGLAFLRMHPAPAPGRLAERPPEVMPSAPPLPMEAPPQAGTRGPESALPAPPKSVRTVRPAEREVIVEPGQAALLLQLARQLNGTRQGAPGLSPPTIVVVPADALPSPIRKAQTHDTVLPHRDHWKKVESQWPYVHWSL